MAAMKKAMKVAAALVCGHCGKGFEKASNLKRHTGAVHSKVKPFKCHECGCSFAAKSNLIHHVKVRHQKSKPFRCSQCDRQFGTNQALKRHQDAIHYKRRPHRCMECDASFAVPGHLRRHVVAVHLKLKPFKCAMCSARCSSRSDLKRHEASVHDETPAARAAKQRLKPKPFACLECSKAYRSKDSLLTHIRSCHTRETPFGCDQCGKSFSASGRLVRHKAQVHGATRPSRRKEAELFEEMVQLLPRRLYRFVDVSSLKHPTALDASLDALVIVLPKAKVIQLETLQLLRFEGKLKTQSSCSNSVKFSFTPQQGTPSKRGCVYVCGGSRPDAAPPQVVAKWWVFPGGVVGQSHSSNFSCLMSPSRVSWVDNKYEKYSVLRGDVVATCVRLAQPVAFTALSLSARKAVLGQLADLRARGTATSVGQVSRAQQAKLNALGAQARSGLKRSRVTSH